MTVARLIERLKQLPDQNATVAIQIGESEPVMITGVEGYTEDYHFVFLTGAEGV